MKSTVRHLFGQPLPATNVFHRNANIEPALPEQIPGDPARLPANSYRPVEHGVQPKTLGQAFVGVILIKQRRCSIMAARWSSQSGPPGMDR